MKRKRRKTIEVDSCCAEVLTHLWEKGIDKTWGGADYNLSGMVYIGMPNVANSLTAIKEWVFDKKVYKLDTVVRALKNNFEGYEIMRRNFALSATFGNNNAVSYQFLDQLHLVIEGGFIELAFQGPEVAS